MKENFLISFSLIIFGIMVIIQPKHFSYTYGITLDYASYRILLGAISILTGMGYLWVTIKNRRGKKP